MSLIRNKKHTNPSTVCKACCLWCPSHIMFSEQYFTKLNIPMLRSTVMHEAGDWKFVNTCLHIRFSHQNGLSVVNLLFPTSFWYFWYLKQSISPSHPFSLLYINLFTCFSKYFIRYMTWGTFCEYSSSGLDTKRPTLFYQLCILSIKRQIVRALVTL